MSLEFSLNTLGAMVKVLPVTLSLTALSFAASLVLAIVIAVIDYFRVPVLRQVCGVYVSFFRGTPLIPHAADTL